MAYKTRIKSSGIHGLTGARFFASMQIDWIGLDMDPLSPTNLNIESASEIIQWLAGSPIIGEFNNRSLEEIKHIINELGLEGAEIPYDMNGYQLQSEGFGVFKKLEIEPESIPLAIQANDAEYLTVNVKGWEKYTDWPQEVKELLVHTSDENRLIIEIATEEKDLDEMLDVIDPEGINLSPENELQPGWGNFSHLHDLFDSLRLAE